MAQARRGREAIATARDKVQLAIEYKGLDLYEQAELLQGYRDAVLMQALKDLNSELTPTELELDRRAGGWKSPGTILEQIEGGLYENPPEELKPVVTSIKELAVTVRANYDKLEAELLGMTDEEQIVQRVLYMFRLYPRGKRRDIEGAFWAFDIEGIEGGRPLQYYPTLRARAFIKRHGQAIKREVLRRNREQIAKGYTVTPNGPLVCELSRQHMRQGQLSAAGTRTVDLGYIRIEQKAFNQIASGISAQARMLLDILMAVAKAGRSEGIGGQIILPVREYMERRGLSDEKAAREQLLKCFEEISKISYYFPTGKNPNARVSIHQYSDIRDGKAIFVFAPMFEAMLGKYTLLPLPNAAYRVDIRKNPNKYDIIRRISEHRARNLGKPNERIIGALTILDGCPGIPTREEVMKTDKKLAQRIVEPFMRDLNATRDTFNISFRGANGGPPPVPNGEGGAYSYDQLASLYIWADLIDQEYPAQTELRERLSRKVIGALAK